jgi:hypothetical protein
METNFSIPTLPARAALTGRSILVLAAATLLVLLGARSSPDDHAVTASNRNPATLQPPEETTQVARVDRAPESRFRLIM